MSQSARDHVKAVRRPKLSIRRRKRKEKKEKKKKKKGKGERARQKTIHRSGHSTSFFQTTRKTKNKKNNNFQHQHRNNKRKKQKQKRKEFKGSSLNHSLIEESFNRFHNKPKHTFEGKGRMKKWKREGKTREKQSNSKQFIYFILLLCCFFHGVSALGHHFIRETFSSQTKKQVKKTKRDGIKR